MPRKANAVNSSDNPKPPGARTRPARLTLADSRRVPWSMVGAGVVIVALIGAIAYTLAPKVSERAEAQRYVPSADNPDPSTAIDGIEKIEYPAGTHVQAPQRVAYDQTPPMGGPHDQYWATCTGTIYPQPIRSENAVHSLEHGAVWIAYDPQKVAGDEVSTLEAKVDGQPYTLMSPYPGLPSPISVQSWGHRLALDDSEDDRLDQFITALRRNPNTHPEAGATCSTTPGSFDPSAPPPFDASAPGPDAVPMTVGRQSAPAAPAPGSSIEPGHG